MDQESELLKRIEQLEAENAKLKADVDAERKKSGIGMEFLRGPKRDWNI